MGYIQGQDRGQVTLFPDRLDDYIKDDKYSSLSLIKSLDIFCFEHLPHLSEALVWELATSDFIAKKENIIMVGPPGMCLAIVKYIVRQ